MQRLRSVSAAAWLAPTVAFIAVAGPFGVVGKLALDEMAWQELLLWTTIAYMIVSTVILAGWRRGVTFEPATKWGIVAGVFIVGTFLTVSLALERGPASQVIPVTASYPVFTAILAYFILREHLTARRLAGTGLVIAGVVLVSI
ncbi:MAG: EamA family transporter [Solirubrobacterales bacterium]